MLWIRLICFNLSMCVYASNPINGLRSIDCEKSPSSSQLTSNIFNKTLVYARLTPSDFPMEAKNMILNSDTITGVFTNVPTIARNCCTITIVSIFFCLLIFFTTKETILLFTQNEGKGIHLFRELLQHRFSLIDF